MMISFRRIQNVLGKEAVGLIWLMVAMIVAFTLVNPKFFSISIFSSMGYQAPLLGLLTLAMLAPMISGGINLAIIFTANISGLTFAWVMLQAGGLEAGTFAILIGAVAALCVGSVSGALMGVIIAYVGAHPILVSLGMMIFLRGLGEFLTKGGDISGFPDSVGVLGHGTLLGFPAPLILFLLVAAAWQILLRRTKHGFSVYMVGSNIQAAKYAGLPTKRTLVAIYAFSGLVCAIAGILMLARFNSVRVGHGEALLLVTVLAVFLGGIDPFGGHGKVFPVILSILILQILSSGLNMVGANQHLATAVWGLLLIAVMILRSDRVTSLYHSLTFMLRKD